MVTIMAATVAVVVIGVQRVQVAAVALGIARGLFRSAFCLHLVFSVSRDVRIHSSGLCTLIDVFDRRCRCIATVSVATSAATFLGAPAAGIAFKAFHGRGEGGQVTVQPFDLLGDQLFDRVEIFRIALGDEGEGLARTASTTGTANAVDIVFGMNGNVEVEDVADIGNIKTAGCNVGSDQQRQPDRPGSSAAWSCANAGPCRHAARRRKSRDDPANGRGRQRPFYDCRK